MSEDVADKVMTNVESSMKFGNLSIIIFIVSIIIAIIHFVVYNQDKDGKCRSRKWNLGMGITSVIICVIWVILMALMLHFGNNNKGSSQRFSWSIL